MISEIEDYCLLGLAFAKANIRDPEYTLRQLRSIDNRVEIQLVKADLLAGPEHLQFAARNALYSFRGEGRRSKSLAMELLLYISCQRQISRAIRVLGVEPEDSRIALVALADSRDAIEELDRTAGLIVAGQRDDNLIEIQSEQKMNTLQRSFAITDKEMDAARFEGETDPSVLKRLIVERSALLDLED